MSEYVYMIEAAINPHHHDDLKAYAIGLCSNPQSALANVHASWPFSSLRLVHAVRSENRSQMLYNVLRIKFEEYHYKFNWYRLAPDAVSWFQAITDDNYVELIRLVENQSASDHGVEVRDVTRRKHSGAQRVKPEPPEMTPEDIEAMKQRLLAEIEVTR